MGMTDRDRCEQNVLMMSAMAITGEDSAIDPKLWGQGQIYRIAAEGQQLTVQARGRGVILQAQGDTVTTERLTMADLSRFHEVSRIQKCYRLAKATIATSSLCVKDLSP
jgi:hypothetical protein